MICNIRQLRIFVAALVMLTLSLSASAQKASSTSASAQDASRPEVLIETTMGNIRVQLYNETPLHRDNFLKLIREYHYYDSLLFHRVIPDFMVQAGDPYSKNAKPGELLGDHSLDYNIPAEIRLPKLYHKYGVLAAAREPDEVNPNRESSSSQFYIVYGKKQTDEKIAKQQHRLDSAFNDSIKYTPEIINQYKTIGGTPHLDGFYTVFGEVIEGMDVVDRIQRVKRDENDRPLEDVRIIKATIIKDLPGMEKPKKKVVRKKVVRRK